MEMEELALRPKNSPIAIEDDAAVSARNANTCTLQSSPSRKRKASSIEQDGQSATGQDAVDVMLEIPPSTFGTDREVKLALKRLRGSISPARDADVQTAAGGLPHKTLSSKISQLTTPRQSTAQTDPRLDSSRAGMKMFEEVAMETHARLPNIRATCPQIVLEHAAAVKTDQPDIVDEDLAAGRLVEEEAPRMRTRDGRAHARAQHGAPSGVPLFRAPLPRKSLKLYGNVPAQPIGSYARFTQRVTGRNRIPTRWKGQPAPFFPSR